MMAAHYMTDFGPVVVSTIEMEQLSRWLEMVDGALPKECLNPGQVTALERIEAKLAAKLADIERVARYKYGVN